MYCYMLSLAREEILYLVRVRIRLFLFDENSIDIRISGFDLLIVNRCSDIDQMFSLWGICIVLV